MFNLDTLTPMQAGRVAAALDKRFNFSCAGVMTLRAFIEKHAATAYKETGDHSYTYSRTRFNRMNHAEQKAYDARLARPAYFFGYAPNVSIQIPKIVYDVLDVREV
jgi:hypothetical protein